MGNSVRCLQGPAGETDGDAARERSGGTAVVDLALAARSGDHDALERLCQTYRPLIASIAARYRTLPAGVERSDLEQEAAQAMCELALQYDPDRGVPFGGYVKAKLGWRISHYLRQEKRRAGHLPLESVDLEAIRGAVVEMPTPGVANPQVARALRRLSPRQRAVIAGIFWRERSARELARELHVSHQAVSALKRRAEASLRRELRADDA